MRKQIDAWRGEFGDAYTDRNVVDPRKRLSAFRSMLDGLAIQTTLEVGCNRGHNLLALSEILGAGAVVLGVDPNRRALAVARDAAPGLRVLRGHGYALPLSDGAFDLVFTVGVLIHVPLEDLGQAIKEIYRTSRRYILAVEYFAQQETRIQYRGQDNMLWKRDFLAHYRETFPGLELLRSGYWGPEDVYDRAHWWLLEKPSAMADGRPVPTTRDKLSIPRRSGWP